MTPFTAAPTGHRRTVHARTPARTPVRLRPDPRAALTGLALAVPAGRGVDPDGRTGLAHMVEHLVLKEPRPGARPFPFVLNAFTTRDLTVYETVCAPEQSVGAVQRLLCVLSANPGASQTLLDTERRIVDVESGGAGGPLDRADSVMGAHRDRDAITPADLTAFHAVHYRPERAVLAVAGAVESDALVAASGLRPCEGRPSGERTARRGAPVRTGYRTPARTAGSRRLGPRFPGATPGTGWQPCSPPCSRRVTARC
ncbi:insulinase family protein [Streptomyces sp. NPDC059906]|uniref:insulinase family protein n=1 Tax=Streptomyces sp. NPDC059906 TaxID=3346997 RepID=UPI0036686800